MAPSKPRQTQRIPDEQRKRRRRNMTLGPEAGAVLDALPERERSAYVEQAVLERAARERKLKRSR